MSSQNQEAVNDFVEYCKRLLGEESPQYTIIEAIYLAYIGEI